MYVSITYKCKLNYFSLILFLSFSISLCFAQNSVVSGVVTHEGEEVIGANIILKNRGAAAVTGIDGSYTLSANPTDTLIFKHIGFKPVEVPIEGRRIINIALQENSTLLDEVIVVGYGTQKKKEVTGAVAKVESKTLMKTATADIGDALQGMVAGVNVQADSGRPGSTANVQIRGLGSINANALGPLYVVDGVPYNNDPTIPPEQIESIDILKDGAAASIYGARASNGVILITTKKGVKGKLKVDFNAYAGIQNITSGTPLMNTEQQLHADKIKSTALGTDPITSIILSGSLEYDSDFVSDVQNNNAQIQNYDLSVSGGLDNLTLYLSTNFFKQNGILINSGFNRLANRITGEFTKGKFKAFATINFMEENKEQEPLNLYERSITLNPWQLPLNALRQLGENEVQIPVNNEIQYSFLSQLLDDTDKRKTNTVNLAVNLEYEVLKNLNYKVTLGRNTSNYYREYFRPQYLVYKADGTFSPTASRQKALLDEAFTFSNKEVLENILTYNLNIDDHKLNFSGVLSYERFNSKKLGIGVAFSETASNDIQNLGAGSETIAPTSNDEVCTLSGKLFRVQYNYRDIFLFSGSFRRDGSSKFSKPNRYGNFIGFSGAWNLHNEHFFDLNQIDVFKLRASWSQVGNQSIPSYAFSPVIEGGVNYPFGANEELNFGFIQRAYTDNNIKWETTISSNLGLDLSLYENRLNLTADVYLNKKQDMLLLEQLAPSAGTHQPRAENFYSVKVTNAGNMTNKGIELSLNYRNKTPWNLKYGITGTFTKNKNEVTNLNGIERGFGNGRPITSLGKNTDVTTFLALGYEAGAFFLIQHKGIIKTEAQLNSYKEIDPRAQLGDMMYIDENEDGKINDADRVYSGSGQPEFELGWSADFNYKNFDLFVQGYLSYGAAVYNGAKLYAYANGRHGDQFNMWSPENNLSNIATDRGNTLHNNVRARSDYFLEDGSYFRLRNINLGYTLPPLKKIGIDRLRLYISAFNPLTLTKYQGYDPEVGGDGLFFRGVDRGNYPVARRFLFGVQAGF